MPRRKRRFSDWCGTGRAAAARWTLSSASFVVIFSMTSCSHITRQNIANIVVFAWAVCEQTVRLTFQLSLKVPSLPNKTCLLPKVRRKGDRSAACTVSTGVCIPKRTATRSPKCGRGAVGKRISHVLPRSDHTPVTPASPSSDDL